MVAINSSTLRANVYETIYDELVAANLLGGTVTVTAAYIDDDQAFPQVVINPTTVSREAFSFDRTNSTQNISVVVEVYTKKNKDIDQISDEIDITLRPLKIQSMQLVDWDEDIAITDPNNNKIHLKTITLIYRRG